jgi:predicted RNA-binding Zn-ribbon protein involved in translation (DUF1610 family)
LSNPFITYNERSLYESTKGRYFVGQSETLWVGDGSNAWAGLFNPNRSGVLLHANVITISNFSDEYITAEIWLNAKLEEEGAISTKVSPANVAIKPEPCNRVEIRYTQSTEQSPTCGVNIFDRIVPPNGTLVSEEDGKFIVPQCGNYTIFLKPKNCSALSKVIVALGWWEEPK